MTKPTKVRANSVLISTFNLYKGGSLSIYRAIKDRLNRDEVDVHEIAFRQSGSLAAFRPGRLVKLPYPIPIFNKFYRLVIEHILVPLWALRWRATHVVMMGNFPALFWFGRQSVYFHNLLYLARPNTYLRIGSEAWLFEALIRLKRPRVLVQTSYVEERLRERFPLVDIQVIGVPMCEDNKIVSGSYSSKPEKLFTLLYPAFYYPHKNHALIISAQSALRERCTRVILTLPEILEIQNLLDSEVIELAGVMTSDALRNALLEVDAILFTSLEESLGLPLLEACALNKPLLAPDLPYVHAAIRNAYLFDPLSIDSFVAAVDCLHEDSRRGEARIPSAIINTSADAFVSHLLS